MKTLKFCCAIALALACTKLQAVHTRIDRYVDINSTAAEPDGKSWETAFRDIQSALDLAYGENEGTEATDPDKYWDHIYVRPGRYLVTETLVGAQEWDRCFFMYGVTDKALKDGNVPESEQVIIDGQNAVACMEVSQYARIFGITFVNGRKNVYSESDREVWGGAGLYNKFGVVSNCIFRNCVSGKFGEAVSKAHIYGGGLALYWDGHVYETLFEDCGISNGCSAAVTQEYPNNRYCGGALYGATKALSGCIFRRNFIADPTKCWTGPKTGSAVSGGTPKLVDSCLFESNYIATAESNASYTMATSGNGITFTNLTFRGNVAPGTCGLSAPQGCLVTDCSFIGNRTTATGSGCLVAPLSNGNLPGFNTNEIRRCLFLDNYEKDGWWDNSGVCLHTHFGSVGYDRALIVRDCAFIGNVNETYGQACLSAWGDRCGSYAMISNCWFEANLSGTNTDWAAGPVNLSCCSNFDVVDCLFKDNVSGKDGNAGYGGLIYAPGEYRTDVYVPTTNSSVRNCAFIGNKAYGILAVQSPVTNATVPGLTIENCTIAGNTMTKTYAIQNLDSASYRTFVYNTAICGNDLNGANYNLNPSKWVDHVFTSYIGPQSAARTALDKDGNIVSDADPKFVDAAGGDYRIKKSSPLRDAGQLRPWIDTERKSRKKCQADLSNMQPVYDATGAKPGCTIERTKRCRRLDGNKPDIGAYEYNAVYGFAVLFR